MASERERREKLLVRKDAVRAFFERTEVRAPARGSSSWMEGFRAVQKNEYLAESFIEELRALIEYIEDEFDTAQGPAAFHDEATVIKEPPPPSRSSRAEP